MTAAVQSRTRRAGDGLTKGLFSFRNAEAAGSAKREASPFFSLFHAKPVLILLALGYLVGAALSTEKIIVGTQGSTHAIEQILSTYSMKNEGEQALENYSREHPIIGMLFGSPVRHELDLPSHEESTHALNADVTHLLHVVRQNSATAAWWSWFLLCLSLFYVILVMDLDKGFATRSVIFSLTVVSVTFFVIGIFAPAMVIWTSPSIPMESGRLDFVLQHQVRGIVAIIRELLTTGHWIIGSFLLLFSIVTPLAKAVLTFFVTGSPSRKLNFKIGEFLHSIGKWSMADVFVAGVLLSLYALKAQEATKSIPCLGLYYFIGYCLLSMMTTELLVHADFVARNRRKKSVLRPRPAVFVGLFACLICFVSASSLYTYEQYTVNTREKIKAPSSPDQLDASHLVLPIHK